MMRTSHAFCTVDPRGVKSLFSTAWRSFACMAGESSATSSRKSVPSWAASKNPRLAEWALVNAPFTYPKKALSMSVSGIAAQLTAINGLSFLVPASWMIFASKDLPVPVSPRMTTLISLFAKRRAFSMTFFILGDWLMKKPSFSRSNLIKFLFAASSSSFSSINCFSFCISSVLSINVLTKSVSSSFLKTVGISVT